MALKTLINLVPKFTPSLGNVRNGNNLLYKQVLRHYAVNDKFDPPYLDTLKPKTPVYDAVNVQIKGFDFPLVESYQSFVHHIALTMELDVEDCWATPATKSKVNRYKHLSTVIDSEYNLTLYERNVQIVDLPSATAGTFIELIQAAIPQGITVTFQEHSEEHDEIRYVPDYELDELKVQLDEIVASRKK